MMFEADRGTSGEDERLLSLLSILLVVIRGWDGPA